MKQMQFFLLFFLFSTSVSAQVFWTEDFNNGCTASCSAVGYTGINGPWTQTIIGTEGADPNQWYVSCAENGHTPNSCGTGCVSVSASATLATLHLGSGPNAMGDVGAAYDAGGLCGVLTCPQTDRRIESPSINCTGQSIIVINFNYIEKGSPPNDDCSVWYYDGLAWSLLSNTAATPPICPGGQGLWTSFSSQLPSSANNNPNVKIGFYWVNNDDGIGSDPSFAVDDITIMSTSLSIVENESTIISIFSSSKQVIQVNAVGQDYKVLGIYNALGEEEKFTQIDNALHLREISSGIYFVSLEVNGVRLSRKILLD